MTLAEIHLTVEFEEEEALRMEISTKFRREVVAREFGAAGLGLDAWWTDDAGDFALGLARPLPELPHAA